MALIIPLKAVPAQQVQAQLNGQACSINVYQFAYGLFVDLVVDDQPVVNTVIAEDRNRIVRDAYLGFDGDIIFADTEGTEDPVFTGLGARWQMIYLTEAEISTAMAAGKIE